MRLEWSDFKSFVDSRALSIQEVTIASIYWLKAIDGPFEMETTIYKNVTAPVGSDQEDYENNYQTNSNKTFSDKDGSALIRSKMAPQGWNFHARAMEFKTATIGSLENNKADGTDMGGVTLKFYDVSDVELTTQGDCDTDCVKTQVDFEPTYDYELMGGWLSMPNSTTENVRIYAIGAPDIPVGLGGSKPMICNVNAKFMNANDRLKIDGRTPKRMSYDAIYHSGKLRLIFKHNAGIKCEFELILENYRP